MSCSKLLPTGYYHLLCFWNREQLERFSVVCRFLKNLIDQRFHSKPYRIFDGLLIHGGRYSLFHNHVYWHPNQDDYSVQQFLAGQKCSTDESKGPEDYVASHSFAEMCPYLGPNIRFKKVRIFVARELVSSQDMNNPEHIAEMESIAYLWRNGDIAIKNAIIDSGRIVAEDFQAILKSPTILQCQELCMASANFSFKDYKVLYAVKVFTIVSRKENIDPNNLTEFLEQPGIKPIVALHLLRRENVDETLDRLKEAFSSAVLANAFKVVFVQKDYPLTVFRETNKSSNEKLELKKGLPVEYLKDLPKDKNITFRNTTIIH